MIAGAFNAPCLEARLRSHVVGCGYHVPCGGGRRFSTEMHSASLSNSLVLHEPQVAPDCCRKQATKGVKAVDAHLLTDPPVGKMGHGPYWPRLHGRGYFFG
jgi:hypothetical protein